MLLTQTCSPLKRAAASSAVTRRWIVWRQGQLANECRKVSSTLAHETITEKRSESLEALLVYVYNHSIGRMHPMHVGSFSAKGPPSSEIWPA